MKIFIKDKPVNIVPAEKLLETSHFDFVIDGKKDKINFGELSGEVLVKNASVIQVDDFLVELKKRPGKKLEEITFSVKKYDEATRHVKSAYTVIKAAGGLVLKDGEVLMIFRLGKWDLPKGKLENGEKSREGAVREVEEECNIKVRLDKKICSTWHTYKNNGKKILKKTDWYVMYCNDDSQMKPQIEEDIQDLKWMDETELRKASYNTYPSIRHVFRHYYQMD